MSKNIKKMHSVANFLCFYLEEVRTVDRFENAVDGLYIKKM